MGLAVQRLPLLLLLLLAVGPAAGKKEKSGDGSRLRFRRKSGTFKVVQVADMHYANGFRTGCKNVLPSQESGCSDLNTTAFLYRVLRDEDPDLVVFTGDNIYGLDSDDAAKSMDAAIAPAIAMKLAWAAVLGNHDQQGTLSTREAVMHHLVGMQHTLSRFNPEGVEIDGYGNYNLEVGGVEGTLLANKSVLNLYFLDSGDRFHSEYDWIKHSQQAWFQQTSTSLQAKYMAEQPKQKEPAPGLVYFHIPLPEFKNFTASDFIGVKQEKISSPSFNSGFFDTMIEAGDVKSVFVGHDHTNDFCGKLSGIQLCYAGGFGYHAYGKAGWSRRARVVSVQLDKAVSGEWGGVESIKTWKRLDDQRLTTIDSQVLWNRGPDPVECTYSFWVQTGTIHGAGTDAKITFSLNPANGRGFTFLVDSDGPVYEVGSLDKFSVPGTCMKPCSLSLKVNSEGAYPDWFPRYIYVEASGNISAKQVFDVDQWIVADAEPIVINYCEKGANAKAMQA